VVPHPRRPVSARRLRTALALLLALAVLLTPGTATAGGGDDGGTAEDGGGDGGAAAGNFVVTVNGRAHDPAPGRETRLRDVTPSGPIIVRGTHVTFRIDPATLGVYDYTLTGAADPQRMVTGPTVVFASKLPVLSAAQLRSVRIADLRLSDGVLVIQFSTAAGKLKVQAKDAPQGGIFQMEQEFGTAVEYVHTLGAGVFYFLNEYTGKINFGNGIAAESAPATHQMLLGKDSPQVATKLFQDATTTRWSVASGGRLGGVLGEDAIELSAGATACTSDCQARNRLNGSVPVPPDPTAPTPLA
jgi:hypothetical protein